MSFESRSITHTKLAQPKTVRGSIHFPPHMTSATIKGNSNPHISSTHVTAGIMDLFFGKSILNVAHAVHGSPAMQIRISVIRSHECYLHFHVLNLAHQLPAPDYPWDYTSSRNPIHVKRECYTPQLGMPCYWCSSRRSKTMRTCR